MAPTYTEITKPAYKRFLLAQDGEFLLFQDGYEINIGGDNLEEITKPYFSDFLLQECLDYLLQEDGYKIEIVSEEDRITEITKPSGPTYTEITRPS